MSIDLQPLLAQSEFGLHYWDYLAIGLFFVILSVIGYVAGRGEQANAEEYFLAGKKLPWYVVGGSFIASNISTDAVLFIVSSLDLIAVR